jgi:hypothetical protein
MFKGQEIQKGIRDKDIKAAYQRFMSPSNNLSNISLFFFVVHIRAIKDMVCEILHCSKKFWSKHMRNKRKLHF